MVQNESIMGWKEVGIRLTAQKVNVKIIVKYLTNIIRK